MLADELGGGIGVPGRLLMCGAALGVAAASYRLVEQPVRNHRALVPSRSRTYVVLAGCEAVSSLAIASLSVYSKHQLVDPFVASLAAARDGYQPIPPECHRDTGTRAAEECRFGANGGSKRALLLGDSHAVQWLAAMDEAAARNDARLTVRALGSCPLVARYRLELDA